MKKRIISCSTVIVILIGILCFNYIKYERTLVKLGNGHISNLELILDSTPIEQDLYLNGSLIRTTEYEYDEYNRCLSKNLFTYGDDNAERGLWFTEEFFYNDDGSYVIREKYYNDADETHETHYDRKGDKVYSESYYAPIGTMRTEYVSRVKGNYKYISSCNLEDESDHTDNEIVVVNNNGDIISRELNYFIGDDLVTSKYSYIKTYDEDGNIASEKFVNGISSYWLTNYEYNAAGKVTHADRYEYETKLSEDYKSHIDVCTSKLLHEYIYDSTGQLTEEFERRYDGNDKLKTEDHFIYRY